MVYPGDFIHVTVDEDESEANTAAKQADKPESGVTGESGSLKQKGNVNSEE